MPSHTFYLNIFNLIIVTIFRIQNVSGQLVFDILPDEYVNTGSNLQLICEFGSATRMILYQSRESFPEIDHNDYVSCVVCAEDAVVDQNYPTNCNHTNIICTETTLSVDILSIQNFYSYKCDVGHSEIVIDVLPYGKLMTS